VIDDPKKRRTGVMSEATVLIPLGDRVIVSPIEAESQSPGGIVLPDVAKDKPTKGRVLAVGNGRPGEDGEPTPLQVKEGDVVLFSVYGGARIELDGQELIVLKEEDLLAKFDR
jgi:chaperonin GroES